MAGTVLHVSPHPDDELLGAPAALCALRDAGWRVVNLVCGLGRKDQRERRAAEAAEAARRCGFVLRVPDEPVGLSRDDDLGVGEAAVRGLVGEVLEELAPEIVVGPSPRDVQPAHEAVARAIRDALASSGGQGPSWWMWAIWGELPLPTLGVAFDRGRLGEILSALEAYEGELERNDYRTLVRGRSEMNASRAPELLFGFGSARKREAAECAELLCEVVPRDGAWRLGAPRWLDPAVPLAPPSDTDAGEWLQARPVTPPARLKRQP